MTKFGQKISKMGVIITLFWRNNDVIWRNNDVIWCNNDVIGRNNDVICGTI